MSLLAVEGLAVARGGIPVLEEVSFTLPAGRALVLRGPNGAGKTTLLRTLAGLQPALAGRVSARPEAVAYAGHADGIKATLSVAENLRFWAAVYGTGDIGPALAAMQLEALAARPAGALSAGQKRRLGLARMAVTGRPLWMMDEPTVSLDVGAVGLFSAMVAAHLAAGGAALIATHIELGLAAAEVLDIGRFRARPPSEGGRAGAFEDFDGAFL